jgi:hypothetical protein
LANVGSTPSLRFEIFNANRVVLYPQNSATLPKPTQGNSLTGSNSWYLSRLEPADTYTREGTPVSRNFFASPGSGVFVNDDRLFVSADRGTPPAIQDRNISRSLVVKLGSSWKVRWASLAKAWLTSSQIQATLSMSRRAASTGRRTIVLGSRRELSSTAIPGVRITGQRPDPQSPHKTRQTDLTADPSSSRGRTARVSHTFVAEGLHLAGGASQAVL